MSQIYAHLISEKFSTFGTEVSHAIKTAFDLSNRTSFPIEGFQIVLSNDFYCVMFYVAPHSVILFVNEEELALIHSRIQEIKDAFAES